MRSLGHTETREERDAYIPRPPAGLQDALEGYLVTSYYYWDDWGADVFDTDRFYAHASAALSSLRPSLDDLHTLIIRNPERGNIDMYGMRLGLFISAGYHFVPENEIRYSLHTPWVHDLGYLLSGKRLIIDGELGDCIGTRMQGELVINGSVGRLAGNEMIGHFAVHGACGDYSGNAMIGSLSDFGEHAIIDTDKYFRMLGMYNGHWFEHTIGGKRFSCRSRRRFIDEITTLASTIREPTSLAHNLQCQSLEKQYQVRR
jgi:glutamate synthase domain-containing protein 3